MTTKYTKLGKHFRLTSNEEMNLQDSLPAENFVIEKNDLTGEIYLSQVEPFDIPKKLYGNIHAQADRILHTFASRPKTTGVLLSGDKGSGKTLLAKEVCRKAQVPIIIVNHPYCGDGFNRFVQKISQPAIFLFDEFEKIYNKESQQQILTLLDGVFPTKKLFLLTTNNHWEVNEHMINRPGRLFYMLEFGGIESTFVEEYGRDNLKNQEHLPSLKKLPHMIAKLNFDQLQAVVEEMNRYGETPLQALKVLNVKPSKHYANYEVTIRDFLSRLMPVSTPTIRGDPLHEHISVDYFPDQQAKEDNEETDLFLSPEDLIEINADKGHYVYRKESLTITLKEIIRTGFDLHQVLE